LVQAQAQRYADTAALFTALGGGWWNRVETNDNTSASGADAPASDQTAQSVTNFNHDQANDAAPAARDKDDQ
jgi:hypothetical protein